MTNAIKTASLFLRVKRRDVAAAELELQKVVADFCDSYHGSMRDMAREMEISVQYLCDIRHGRRKVSDAVVEKLCKMK